MKKKGTRKLLLVTMVLICTLFMAACGKKATPENLLTDISKNLKDVKSVAAVQKAEMTVKEGGMEGSIGIDMEISATDEPSATYMKGTIALKQGAASLEMELEAYGVEEDGEIAVYTCMDGMWEREVTDEEDDVLDENVYEELLAVHDAFKMSEDTVKVEGKECLEMSGKVEAEVLEAILGEDMLELLDSGAEILEDAEDEGKVDCTIAVYKDSILPARIAIDTEDIMIEVVYKDYNKIEEIKVPEEALEATGVLKEDSKEDTKKEEKKDSKKEKNEKSGKAAQSGKLGDNWDSYTVQINDTVVTFPCTIEEFEATGFTLDTDDTPYDYVINAGKDEITFFVDGKDTDLLVYMINQTEEACELKDCLVGGISINDYELEDNDLKIVFPGGITMESTEEDLLAAYGEPEYQDAGEAMNSYLWYELDTVGSDNMCYIECDPKTGKLTCMSISRFE